jgi:RNA polymerase sigma-70 factor, ECF subfamily
MAMPFGLPELWRATGRPSVARLSSAIGVDWRDIPSIIAGVPGLRPEPRCRLYDSGMSRIGSSHAFVSSLSASTSLADVSSADVREIVLEQMKEGRSGDHLANCVLSHLGWCKSQGIQEFWPEHQAGYAPFLDVQWRSVYGSYATWASKRRIESYEQELLDGGYLDYSPINPFQEDLPRELDDANNWEQPGNPNNPRREGTELEVDVSFETSKTLVPKQDWNVTRGWEILQTPLEKLIRDLTPIHFELAQSALRTYYVDRSWLDDLIQEARMEVFKQLPLYRGEAAFTTWAWRVSWIAMLKYVQRVILKHRPEISKEAVYEETDHTPSFEDTSDLRLTLAQAMSEVPDSHLVLLQALDCQDAEIAEGNLRMRRHRARKQLQIALGDDLALSA